MLRSTSLASGTRSLPVLVGITSTVIMPLNLSAADAPARDFSGAIASPPTITYVPSVEDYYPAVSKELRETGVVTVLACYGDNGRMVKVDVKETSRSKRLDDAALKLAKQVRVKPGTRDGRVAAGCITLPVAFELPEVVPKA